MSTIKQVAQRAGVSPSTVSIVLNSRSTPLPISQSTRERVLKAARELKYNPNIFARSLRTKRSYSIAILAFDIVDPYCAHTIRGVEEVISESEFHTLLCDVQNNEEKMKDYFKLFKGNRVEGIVVMATTLELNRRIIAQLHEEHIPLVVIGKEMPGPIPCVVMGNLEGSFSAAEHLIKLGHQRISFILGPSQYVDSRQREKGGRSALRKYGIPFDGELVAEENAVGWGPEAGYQSMKKLLKKRKKFTAVVAFDDISAFGAIRAISEKGLKVPDDISVVGFDDLPMSAFSNPPLTTIHYPMREMGRQGASLLLKLLGGQTIKKRKLIAETHLVVRKSSGPAAM